jgi:hypothetical protein
MVVRQNGVILQGASSVVDPYTGTASLGDFKLASGGNWASITYDVVSNGVVCLPASSGLLAQASSVQVTALGNSVNIATIPLAIYVYPDAGSVYAGVQSTSFFFSVIDANGANLVGVVVRIQVRCCCTGDSSLFVSFSHFVELGTSFVSAQ